MLNKLLVDGFSKEQAEQLVKGKEIRVMYGLVKLNSKGELITKYHDKSRIGRIERL